MADKTSYPQIPSTVWWGVRAVMQRSPNAAINERLLGIELDVQEVAARQYLAELKRVGILNDDNRSTALAQRWRHDETYREAVEEILTAAYPEGLIEIAPPGNAERQKIISWFTREGLGTGTAKNKAATYLLLSSETPGEMSTKPNSGTSKKTAPLRSISKESSSPDAPSKSDAGTKSFKGKKSPAIPASIPLNVNVQIHISAEASGDQIESIFSAMKRYLYDTNAT